MEELADALRRCSHPAPPTAELAGALQRRLDEAVEKGAARLEPRLDRMDARLGRQDETLRLMWRQMKGNTKLPIDD